MRCAARRPWAVMLVAMAAIISFGDCKKVSAKPYSSQLVGCFKDDSSVPAAGFDPNDDPVRDLPIFMGGCMQMDPEQCNTLCKGYGFFALPLGFQCRCAEQGWKSKYEALSSGQCSMPCRGNHQLKCGAQMKNSVYRTWPSD